MYVIFFTLGFCLFIFSFCCSFIKNEKEKLPGYLLVILGAISGMLIMLGRNDFIEQHTNIPTALDVYQDKTTLQITYRDSIPVDTVVVFK
jgi:hypothetical protein